MGDNAADTPRILIAGIGNIFLGDDGFGSEVARRLLLRKWPQGVRVVDFGIRGLDLAYTLLDRIDFAVLIDATPRGDRPGTLYTIRPDFSEETAGNASLVDAHTMDPVKVLAMARSLGAAWGELLVVGCEPADLGGDQGRMGLTEPVAAAVDEAERIVLGLVDDYLKNGYQRKPRWPGMTRPEVLGTATFEAAPNE